MLAAAIANRRSLALELMQHNYNIQQQKLFTWASPEVLLSWTAVFLDCLVYASTPHRLASLPFGHAACLGVAKTMPLAGCVRV